MHDVKKCGQHGFGQGEDGKGSMDGKEKNP